MGVLNEKRCKKIQQLSTLIINKQEYISSVELFEKAPVYCKVSRTGRDLIKKKKLLILFLLN